MTNTNWSEIVERLRGLERGVAKDVDEFPVDHQGAIEVYVGREYSAIVLALAEAEKMAGGEREGEPCPKCGDTGICLDCGPPPGYMGSDDEPRTKKGHECTEKCITQSAESGPLEPDKRDSRQEVACTDQRSDQCGDWKIKLSQLIATWNQLHVKDTGEIGFFDLDKALQAAGVQIQDDLKRKDSSLPDAGGTRQTAGAA